MNKNEPKFGSFDYVKRALGQQQIPLSAGNPDSTGDSHARSPAILLSWSDPAEPKEKGCHYNHTIAETPFGRLLLTWKGWKDDPGFGFDETPWGEVEYRGWSTVREAQEWAEGEMARRCMACFSLGVEPGSADCGRKTDTDEPKTQIKFGRPPTVEEHAEFKRPSIDVNPDSTES